MKTTHIALVLDRSGSMASTAEEAVNNYNDQVRAFKKTAEETGVDVKVSMVTFSTDVFEHLWEVSAADLQECKQGDFVADGWTAMLDGIGYAIEKFRETTDYNSPDNNYMFVIITDGQENKSQHYNWSAIQEMMDSLQKTDRWTFTFMGCDKAYITEAAHRLNVPVANCAIYNNYSAAAAKVGYRRSAGHIYKSAVALARGGSSCNTVYSADADSYADFAVDSSIDPAPTGPNLWANPQMAGQIQPEPVTSSGTAVFSTGNKVTAWKA